MKNFSFISVLATILALCILVSCIKDETKPPELINISVNTSPTKVEYYAGDVLDLTGLVVLLSFDNGASVELAFSDFANEGITCLPADGTTLTEASTMVTITHTFTGKSTSQAIKFITLTDINGNSYKHVKIGNQIWMAENLKTIKYNDGTAIPFVTDITAWDTLTTPGYCWYDNDEIAYADKYGALYNWYTIETGKICPTGWHVPTDSEWTELTDYLTANGHSGTEGAALRATSGWNNGVNGTDDYGFAALPGGYLGYGKSDLVGRYSYWWSSTEYSSTQARLRIIMDLNNLVLSDYNNKKLGFSVRCTKD